MSASVCQDVYRIEVDTELNNILSFWLKYSPDNEYGGFIGQLSSDGHLNPLAPKGAVLNARILWTFSAAFRHSNNLLYRNMADKAYAYFNQHFIDSKWGGVYWSVTPTGEPLDTHKQIYALAFAIYGLSEYYQISHEPAVLITCQELYKWIQTHSYDSIQGGYFEAFSQEGGLLDTVRLSDKDRNDPKTMNTHLHILEGYTNLYRIWPNADLADQIRALLLTFQTHIVDPHSNQMWLFFTTNWQPTTSRISFGHNIEAAWLLLEAAETLGDHLLIDQFRQLSIAMAHATTQAVQPDGSLYHEVDHGRNHIDTHREWWVSAEAMVGFLNAYQLTGLDHFYQHSVRSWEFIQQHLLDKERGEWHWGVFDNYRPMTDEDKIGFWKCPYHNVRACLEVSKRLQAF